MIRSHLLSVLILFLGNQSVNAAGAIADEHRISFYNEIVPAPICFVSPVLKVGYVKRIERCLVLENDPNSAVGKIIIKLSCNPDEVRSIIQSATNDYCKSQRLSGQPSTAAAGANGSSSTAQSSDSTQAGSSTTTKPATRNLTRPSATNRPSSQQRQVIYTDAPAQTTPASSSDSTKSTPAAGSTPRSSAPAAAPAAASSGRSSGGFVVGGCGTPEQCEAYMAEAAKPKYGWQSPRPFMNAPINKMDFMTSEDGHKYELPTGACGPDNQGELVAIDYGTETVVAACMGGANTKTEDIMEKIKKADVSKLPKVVAIKKEKYTWECLVKPLPPPENGVRVCGGPGVPSCEKVSIGKVWVVEGQGCGSYKCVRTDGGGLATEKPKPKEKGPCDK